MNSFTVYCVLFCFFYCEFWMSFFIPLSSVSSLKVRTAHFAHYLLYSIQPRALHVEFTEKAFQMICSTRNIPSSNF